MIRIKDTAFAALVAAACGSPLSAQEAAATPCTASERVAWIGITGLICNCTLGERWVFRAEPRVSGIRPGSPAAGALREGDVIVAVDGHLITTAEGARRLASPPAGASLDIAVRRDGRMVVVSVTPTPVCPADPRLAVTPQAPGGFLRVSPPDRARAPVLTPAPDAPQSRAVIVQQRVATAASAAATIGQSRVDPRLALPNAWFGFGIACSNCGWEREAGQTMRMHFGEAPRILSVEPGSPAARVGLRAGDVITRIDGQDVTSADGGRRFASIEPGEVVLFTYTRGNATPRTVSMTAERRPSVNAALAAIIAQTDTLLSRAALRERQPAPPPGAVTATGQDRNLLERVRIQAQNAAASSAEARFRPLRFSGSVGNADVEVRGGSEVITTILEEGRDIVIITGDTQIRVRVSEQVRRR